MIIHYTNFGIFLEPNRECERNVMVNKFLEMLHEIVFKHNHMHKFKGMDHVTEMIREICNEKGMPILIEYREDLDTLGIEIKDTDVKYLPFILKEFRTRYRKGD